MTINPFTLGHFLFKTMSKKNRCHFKLDVCDEQLPNFAQLPKKH